MSQKRVLSEEDQARVDEYLSRPQHQVEREPFKPMRLFVVTVSVLVFLTLFSWWMAVQNGVM